MQLPICNTHEKVGLKMADKFSENLYGFVTMIRRLPNFNHSKAAFLFYKSIPSLGRYRVHSWTHAYTATILKTSKTELLRIRKVNGNQHCYTYGTIGTINLKITDFRQSNSQFYFIQYV